MTPTKTLDPTRSRVAGARARPANQVRLIGGQYRRRLLEFPDSDGLRPTPDRVRETLFNWLGQDLPGWSCLDLFAGSGALGFEAASRGAARVVLIEQARLAADSLIRNKAKLAAARVEIVRADACSWLAANRTPYDLIFLDPPFASGLAATLLPQLPAHLVVGGQVYVEQAEPVVAVAGLALLRSGRAGRAHHALLQKDAAC